MLQQPDVIWSDGELTLADSSVTAGDAAQRGGGIWGRGNVTIDQYAAETIPGETRFPSLTIGSEDGIHGLLTGAILNSLNKRPKLSRWS